jgi:hypothetical protein
MHFSVDVALSATYTIRMAITTLRLFSLLAFTVAVVSAADPSLPGEWKIQRSVAGRDSTQTCTFTQKENDLTGTCNTQNGAVKLTGKVDGKKVTWTIKTDSEGGPVTVVYTGTVDSDSLMSGTVTAVEFSIDGQFTATRSK